MIYDLSKPLDREKFKLRVNHLFANCRQVELVDKTHRSLRQNAYLHTILGILAIDQGETIEYVKEHYPENTPAAFNQLKSIADSASLGHFCP